MDVAKILEIGFALFKSIVNLIDQALSGKHIGVTELQAIAAQVDRDIEENLARARDAYDAVKSIEE